MFFCVCRAANLGRLNVTGLCCSLQMHVRYQACAFRAGSLERANNIMKVLLCLRGDQPLPSLLNYWSGSVVTAASQEEGSGLPK